MKDNLVISKLCILVFLISLVGTTDVSAQWADKMINRSLDKVQRQAEKRINKGVDRGIDKSMDKAEEKAEDAVTKKKKGEIEKTGNDSDFLEEAAEEDFVFESDFVGQFEMEIDITMDGKSSEGSVNYFFNKKVICMDITMDNHSAKIITDHGNRKMTMIDKANNTAIVMVMPPQKTFNTESEDYEVTRDGSTRFIAGRKCVKYLIKSDSHKTTAWVDESVRFDYDNMMKAFNSQATGNINNGGSSYMEEISGFPVETETVSKNGKEKTVIRIISFEEDRVDMNAFSTEGYKVTDMSAFGQ